LIVVLLTAAFSSASEPVTVSGIRYWSYPDYTRVVIDLSGESEFAENRLSNPDRLYFDIENSIIEKEIQSDISIKNGMLRSVRAGQRTKDTVRVVLDLEKIKNYKVFALGSPSRIVVDIFGHVSFSAKKKIVIDAGHGGKDPGAIGPKRLYEKDVVLDIALKLKKILSKNPDFEIFLTRNKDVFIPLEQRTAIANSKNADLFVSIHANASRSSRLKGIETYFLNWTDEEEAMKVAARENKISLKQMRKMRNKISLLDMMLEDLSRQYKRDESIRLAHYVQKSMVTELDRNYRHPIIDLGVKNAWFFVLIGAEMPSILVEVSFVSNPLEARLLRKGSYRTNLAESIADGIDKYISLMPEAQKIAHKRK
jgi:N-acetylmuramoyl-L-alanine amidase